MFNHVWLSRLSTTKESSTSLVKVGPAKVKACKSVLFTEGTPEVKIKYTCLMQSILYVHSICDDFSLLIQTPICQGSALSFTIG